MARVNPDLDKEMYGFNWNPGGGWMLCSEVEAAAALARQTGKF